MKILNNVLMVLLGIGASTVANGDTLPPNLRQGLILYYDFEGEPAAGKIADKSGHGNDGLPVNVQFVKDGHQGGAASFGLTNSYITVPNKKELNPPRLTLAAWIKTSYSDNQWRRIFDKDFAKGFALSNGGDYEPWYQQGQLVWEAGRNSVESGQRRIDDGLWHHVAATYDGTVQLLYLDGQICSKQRSWQGRVRANNYDLTIGENRSNRAVNDTETSFNGMMDDVMMFDRALSADEVQVLFKSQSGALNSPTAASPGKRQRGKKGQGGQDVAVTPTANSQGSPLQTLSQQAINATAWVLAPLEQSVPGEIRENLTSLREDLLDEAKANPVAGPEAYAIGRQLCDALIAVHDERDQASVRAGYRAAQAEANTGVSTQAGQPLKIAIEARRNYMMSWPQYAREKDDRAEIQRQQNNVSSLTRESVKVAWSNRTAVLRKTLDSLYAKYRDAMRQGKK
jgi:hypothetical protein